MPARLVEQNHGMGAGRHGVRNLGEVQGHGLARAAGQDQTGALALIRTDRSEDVGR
jgi:hypothetical protein